MGRWERRSYPLTTRRSTQQIRDEGRKRLAALEERLRVSHRPRVRVGYTRRRGPDGADEPITWPKGEPGPEDHVVVVRYVSPRPDEESLP